MKRRPFRYESQAFHDESFRRAQLAAASRPLALVQPIDLRLLEPAPQKLIAFPVSQPVDHDQPGDARLAV